MIYKRVLFCHDPLVQLDRNLKMSVVCVSMHPCIQNDRRDSEADFLQTWYSDEVPWGLDTCDINIGCVPKYGNSGFSNS